MGSAASGIDSSIDSPTNSPANSSLKGPVPQALRRVWAAITTEQLRWLTLVAFYGVFANLSYWVVARGFGFLPLGWFCVEYVTVGLVALIASRFLAAGLLLAAMLADLLCGISITFNLPVRECLANLTATQAFDAHRLFSAATVGLLILLTAATAARLPGRTLPRNQRLRAAVCLVVFTVVIVGTDCFSIRRVRGNFPGIIHMPQPRDGVTTSQANMLRLARIPLVRLVRFQTFITRMNTFEKLGPASAFPMPSATAVAIHNGGVMMAGGGKTSPNLVLVLVESWGLPIDPSLQQALAASYLEPNLNARYQVIQGSVAFHGSTIPGEARELCGSAVGFHLLNAPAADLSSCLPARLDALGYQTIGVHGMSGHMFDREGWYRIIGFQQRWFHEQLRQQGLRDCTGAFIGTCDADIAAWIGRRLDEDAAQPRFIHWMTLNSHLPVPLPLHLPNAAPCTAVQGLAPDSPLCSWYQLISNVHRSVVQMATGPLTRPTVFVIVGDHAPPFGDPALRDRFSQSDVPYVVLVPRSQLIRSGNMLAHSAANPVPGAKASSRQLP